MSKQVLLFPFGGNAREALAVMSDINELQDEWEVLGFADDNKEKWGQEYCGVKVLGDKEVVWEYPEAKILAVPGSPTNYKDREAVIKSLNVEDSRFVRIVHPTAVIAKDAQIGINTLVMAKVVINAGVSLGNHCIVLPNTTISHDAQIADYCCVGSNVAIAGGVDIKEDCYIGSGANIRNDIQVGRGSLIGMGSVVVNDIGDNVVVAGNPAKKIRGA